MLQKIQLKYLKTLQNITKLLKFRKLKERKFVVKNFTVKANTNIDFDQKYKKT